MTKRTTRSRQQYAPSAALEASIKQSIELILSLIFSRNDFTTWIETIDIKAAARVGYPFLVG